MSATDTDGTAAFPAQSWAAARQWRQCGVPLPATCLSPWWGPGSGEPLASPSSPALEGQDVANPVGSRPSPTPSSGEVLVELPAPSEDLPWL